MWCGAVDVVDFFIRLLKKKLQKQATGIKVKIDKKIYLGEND